ncbi:VCBS repeat-containing protein [Nitrobacteraceae bacterium AZCC 2161]
MNYAGTFEFSHFGGDAPSGASVGVEAKNDAISHADGHTVIVPDAHLLFSGDYKRAGVDLVLSKDGHDYTVSDYFKGHSRAALSSPDGANLSGDLVNALTGEVQLAQLGGGATAAATVIGRVTKLTGSATAIRNGVSIQLNMGDNVQKGDVVQAGADSSLGLTFIDGTVFGLSANARMVLNEMVYDPNGSSNSSLLSLVQGTITFVAGETAKHGDMKVDTPVATMGIRGTAVLVEIGFEVPGQGGAPPVKFQVLVERGGRVGSYVLYSKTGSILGTVNQAGQVTSVLGNGDTTTGQAPPLTQLAQDIITYTFEQFLLNNPNPRSSGPSGSTPANPVPGSSNPDFPQFHQQDLVPGQPIAPIKFNFQGDTPGTPPIAVTLTVNTPPTIVVTPVVVTLPVNKTSFDIKDQVHGTDPDPDDVFVPYVAGTGHVISATGPSNTPSGLDLKTLVTIDPATGHVSYDPAAFKFLPAGKTAVYTIGFDSQSGPDTIHETLTFTVDGTNDAPVVAAALTAPVVQGDAAQDLNLLAGAIDPDAGETATLTITHLKYSVDGGTASATAPAGVSLSGTTLHVDPKNPAFAYLAQGETKTIVVSYDVTDANGATVAQAETVTITGTNDAPVVAAALTVTAAESDVAFTANLLAGASDVDTGETATLSVTNVKYAVDGGTASATAPMGISLTGATLSVDPKNAAFDHLAQGETTKIAVSYDVTDAHGATTTQTETITITGTNDAPAVTAALTATAAEGDVAFTANLLTGATDVDTGETATLSVTNVKYAVDGGMPSTAAPTGLSLAGATLSVDPKNAAFDHLAQGETTTIVVSYDVTDSHGATVTQTETVTVTGVNDAPVITGISIEVPPGGTVVLEESSFTIADPDNTRFTFTVSNVTGGTFQVLVDGEWVPPVETGGQNVGAFTIFDAESQAVTFTTADLAAGHVRFVSDGTTDSPTFSVQADDGGTSNHLSPVFDATIEPGENHDPVTSPVTLDSIAEDSCALIITEAELLANATDVDGQTLHVNGLHVSSGGGTLCNNGDGTWTYTPASNYSGQVSFAYDVNDGVTCVSSTATLDITPVNDAPVVSGVVTGTAIEDGSSSTLDALTHASDVDTNTVLTVVNIQATLPAGVTYNSESHSFTLDPSNAAYQSLVANHQTTVTVTYSVSDGTAMTPAWVSWTVTGSNDSATIVATSVGSDAGAVTEDDSLHHTASGQLTVTDPDGGENVFATPISLAGLYGTFTFNTVTGVWGYTLDDSKVQFLDPGVSTTDKLTVTSADGTAHHDIAVTITGTADGPLTNVWTGNAHDNNWNTPGNWSLGIVPTGDEIVDLNIPSPPPVTFNLSGLQTIAELHIGPGTELDLTGTGTLNITGSLVNDGDIELSPGATLEVNGVVQNGGTLLIDAPATQPGATLLIDGTVTLEGGGTVTLDGTADKITGGTADAKLVNADNTIDGYGTLGDGHLDIVNQCGGTIVADTAYKLVVDVRFADFVNYGLIESSAAGGLEIRGDLENHGTLDAKHGVLDIDGDLTGHGLAKIDGGTLEFGGCSDANVQFSGSSSDELILDRDSHFTGTVSGLSYGDAIDLQGISPWQLWMTQYSGVVQVHYGWGSNDYFTLTDPGALNHLELGSDHHGGTELVWNNDAPELDTSDAHLAKNSDGSFTISGVSVCDGDSSSSELYKLAIDGHDSTGLLSELDQSLENGFTFTPAPSSPAQATVGVTVTDGWGASDHVNFIFNTAVLSSHTQVTLTGTNENDVIFATSNTDTLTGGGGADQFVFGPHSGPADKDVIKDFQVGIDKIEFDHIRGVPALSGPFGDLQLFAWELSGGIQQKGNDTLIHLEGDTLLLTGVQMSSLHASDFIVHPYSNVA